MIDALRVEHADLPGGLLLFSDEEINELEVRREQIVVTQIAQAGNASMVYVGEERYEFDLQFNIFRQSTLQKLEAIRLLRATFSLFPFIIEEPSTVFTVFWPEQPTMTERWVRGRRFAHWDKPLVWIESRVIPCVPIPES